MTDPFAIETIPGLYEDLPADLYHGGVGVGSSTLKTIHSATPAHARAGMLADQEDRTDAMIVGDAFHAALLEPDRFTKAFRKGPDVRRNSNVWKEAVFEADKADAILLRPKDFESVEAMRDSVLENRVLRAWLAAEDARVEVSGYWYASIYPSDDSTLCRIRPDWVSSNLGTMIDVKSAASAAPGAFARQVANLGYHLQAAFYTAGWEAITGEKVDFLFLAVEKDPPFASALYRLDEDTMEIGYRAWTGALEIYADCQAHDYWPGYPGEPQPLRLPGWSPEWQTMDE